MTIPFDKLRGKVQLGNLHLQVQFGDPPPEGRVTLETLTGEELERLEVELQDQLRLVRREAKRRQAR